jgi:hypothetical protein
VLPGVLRRICLARVAADRDPVATHQLGRVVALAGTEVLDLDLSGIYHLGAGSQRSNHEIEFFLKGALAPSSTSNARRASDAR